MGYRKTIVRNKIAITGIGTTITLLAFLMTLSFYGVTVTDFNGNHIPDLVKCAGTALEPCVQEIKICSQDYDIFFNRYMTAYLNDSQAKFSVTSNITGKWAVFSFKNKTLTTGQCWYLKLKVTKPINASVKWGLDYQSGNLDPLFEGYSTDDIFKNLIYNGNGAAEGMSIFTLTNPLSVNLKINSSKLFMYVEKSNTFVNTISIDILSPVSKEVPTTQLKYISGDCIYANNITGNLTPYFKCNTPVFSMGTKTITTDEFIPLEGIVTFKSKQTYTFKVTITWKPILGDMALDWKPTIDIGGTVFKQDKWAWYNTSFYNNLCFNHTTTFSNYSDAQVLDILNDSNWGNNSCKDTVSCNDSSVIWMNSTTEQQISHWFENYTATGNSYLWSKPPRTNDTVNTICIYYNSSIVTRPYRYNGSQVFLRFNDFENYSVNDRPSADFGANTLATAPEFSINNTNCLSGKCLVLASGVTDGIIYGLMSRAFDQGILEFNVKARGGANDATFYLLDGINGTVGSGIGSVGSIVLPTVWSKVTLVWNRSGTNAANVTVGTVFMLSPTSNISQFMFPYHTSGNLPFWMDNVFLRAYLPQNLVTRTFANASSYFMDMPIYITPNYPNNATTNTTQGRNISFGFTPVFNGSNPVNCSLFSNVSGSWGFTQPNISVIINSTVNKISNQFTIDGSYLWSIICYSHTGSTNSTMNRTLNIAETQNVTIVTLNYPDNKTQNLTASNISFGFTPVFYGGKPIDCTAYTNHSEIVDFHTNSIAFTDSNYAGYSPNYLRDNLLNAWVSQETSVTHWAQLSFPANHTVTKIEIPINNYYQNTTRIEVWTSQDNMSTRILIANISNPIEGFLNFSTNNTLTGSWTFDSLRISREPTWTVGGRPNLFVVDDIFVYEVNLTSSRNLVVNQSTIVNNSLNNIYITFADGNYTWKIGCQNEISENFSVNRTLTVDGTGPTMPSNLINSTIGLTWINVTWGASTDFSGIQKYLIFRNGTNIANTTTALSYNNTGLTASAFYQYNVSAMDGVGHISANASVRLNTIDITSPSTPSNLRNLTFISTSINITWDAAIDDFGIQKYLIFRNGTNIVNITVLSYNNTGLSEYTWYRYNVSAMDNYNNIGPNATLLVRTKDITLPTAPTLFSSQRGLTNIYLMWNVSSDSGSGVAGYIIFRNGSNIANSTVANYNDTNCNVGTSYSYIIEAYDNDGNRGANSSTVVNSTYTATIIVTLPAGTGRYILNATNATGTFQPYNQTSSVPIFKVNYSGEISSATIYIRLNQTLNTCMQSYFMPNNSVFNISQSWNVSTSSYVALISLANNSIQNLWSYVKYNNCTPGQTFTRKFIFGV